MSKPAKHPERFFTKISHLPVEDIVQTAIGRQRSPAATIDMRISVLISEEVLLRNADDYSLVHVRLIARHVVVADGHDDHVPG